MDGAEQLKPGLKANLSFLGQIPELGRTGTENEDDFHPVPASDRGNATYSDHGMLGTYEVNPEPFRDPPDVKHFTGYGATEADLQRGYQVPTIRDCPAYDLDNYKYRSSQPMLSDLDEGGDAMNDDYAFRRKNERSRGFLTRPRPPTDR
jgi:hypothetical protein